MDPKWAKLDNLARRFTEALPPSFRATAMLRGFSLLHVPLLLSLRPVVKELSDKRAVIQVPLNRWTRNHLKTMYFGSLAMGAESAAGLLTIHHCRRRSKDIHFSFKDFHADFLRRPDGDVQFICDAGDSIEAFVEKVATSEERHNLEVGVRGVLAAKPKEVVASFTLTVSLKRRST